MSASREEWGRERSEPRGSAHDEAAERVCARAGANSSMSATQLDTVAHKLTDHLRREGVAWIQQPCQCTDEHHDKIDGVRGNIDGAIGTEK